MARITGHKPGKAYHRSINCHIYEDQLPFVDEQLSRIPYKTPKFYMHPKIQTLEDLETWVTVDDFYVEEYFHHAAINYPFAV